MLMQFEAYPSSAGNMLNLLLVDLSECGNVVVATAVSGMAATLRAGRRTAQTVKNCS